jgi:hypothetical protein
LRITVFEASSELLIPAFIFTVRGIVGGRKVRSQGAGEEMLVASALGAK